VAYIHEARELGISRAVTYGELFRTVTAYTAALKSLGGEKGGRVLLYLPNSIEVVSILFACGRMGAIFTCVFAGFAPSVLADRIELTRPKLIFTQDFTFRRDRKVGLKELVDVTTPVTVERLTNNFHGWQPRTPRVDASKIMRRGLSKTLPGPQNFYMVGQWAQAMIGVPTVAVMAGNLIKELCKKDGKQFVTSISAGR